MNKKQTIQRRHHFSTFRQLCNHIPVFLVSQLALETIDNPLETTPLTGMAKEGPSG
jgi:hypothetical protein